MDFEKKLNQLEKIVNEMEGGDLSLEESLKKFELGVKLSRECHAQLSQAEQTVKKLVEEEGGFKLSEFEVSE
ncbi:MAG: exodeoxyribonuclease VII small subunit [Bdellovibrionales bacterium]|nr:exodeoxyribonuclease VII small subunit [Bdellovibrionales bacterium]